MKVLSFLSNASRTVCDAVSSCRRRLPSIQISTTVKVALFAATLFSIIQSSAAEKALPGVSTRIPCECPGSVNLVDNLTKVSIELDFGAVDWVCTNLGPKLSSCFLVADFSAFEDSAYNLMTQSINAFNGFSTCLKYYKMINQHITVIDLDKMRLAFIHLVGEIH